MEIPIHWNKLKWVNTIIQTKRNKPYLVSSDKLHLNNVDNPSNLVGHSALKELDSIDFFEGKQMIEDTESELTESSKINSKTDNLALPEEEDFDESIPIYI